MALLLTVCGGSSSPWVSRCGWWSCGCFVESDSSWWPKVSERQAGASPGGPSFCPFALHGPFRPPLVTCVSAVCPGTWCWCSGRENLSCWLCRQSGTWWQWSRRPSRSPLGAARKEETTEFAPIKTQDICLTGAEVKRTPGYSVWTQFPRLQPQILCYIMDQHE